MYMVYIRVYKRVCIVCVVQTNCQNSSPRRVLTLSMWTTQSLSLSKNFIFGLFTLGLSI